MNVFKRQKCIESKEEDTVIISEDGLIIEINNQIIFGYYFVFY